MNSLSRRFFILFFFLFSAASLWAAEPQEKEEFPPFYFVKDLGRTGWYVFSSPARWEEKDGWLVGGTLGVTAGFMIALDDNVRNTVQHERFEKEREFVEEFEEVASSSGKIITLGTLWAGFGGAGLLLDDDRAKRTSMELLEAAAIQGLLVWGLKRTFGRARPYAGEGPHAFELFGSGRSFPSGHTAFVFSLASTVHAEYPNLWVGLVAYGLASWVGLERISEDAHWTSDVFFSALLGAAIGRATVAFHKKKIPVQPVAVTGLTDSDLLGLALQYRF